ncbi:MAG: tyrosine--tRNA ligase [Planctomycetes bacterium]|nr:tyrosine--tRNA ligase [Planctomycetota bacterium]
MVGEPTAVSFLPVDEQLQILERGVVDLVHRDDLRRRLEQSRTSGKPLRVKFGIDPSSPDIHLGHTVPLRKLRDFQRLGHRVIVLWGTATAMVGDPTGRNKTRPPLTREMVESNKQTYRAQVGAVLDVSNIEERENGEWFHRQSFMDCISLASRYTVARMLERDDFQKRHREQQPIAVHEFLYPLLQGWDSVELQCDIEIGGSDQLFNLLVGRDLQTQAGQTPQVCLTMPLLEGLDGAQKMSKSLGNYVGVAESASAQFGKLMRVPNALLEKYFLLLTDVPVAAVQPLLGNPLEAKFALADAVVAGYHGVEAARAARAEYDRVHQQGGVPDDLPEWRPAADTRRLPDGRITLPTAIAAAGLAASSSEARRLIQGKGVRIDGAVVADVNAALGPGSYVAQVGKARAARLVIDG